MDASTREAVMAMDAERRLAYFVRKAADLEQVWGLVGPGWATTLDEGGAIALAVWPGRDFAAACAAGAWEHHVPTALPLADFLTQWLPALVRESRLVAVFPTALDAGVFMRPELLGEAIHRELWQYAGT